MRYAKLLLVALAFLATPLHASLAFDLTKASRYPSPDMFRPNVDRLNIRGAGTNSTVSNLATSETTPSGSVGEGAMTFTYNRTGGFGQYGNILTNYLVTKATPSGQFDVGLTSWATHKNLTGGQLFGAWFGANTPSSGTDYSGNQLSETYTGGAAVGVEVNVGNRWADFGLQSLRGPRFTVGLQLVPDTLPASDGPPPASYPGTFAILVAPSFRGHKWWTGYFSDYGTIMPGGYAALISGSYDPASAPQSVLKIQGYFQNGIDFTGGAYSGAAMAFSSGQVSGTASPGGGGVIPATAAGYLIITVDGVPRKIPYLAN